MLTQCNQKYRDANLALPALQRQNCLKRADFEKGELLKKAEQARASMLSSFIQAARLFSGNTIQAECAQFRDKNLAGALDKIDEGLEDLLKKYPGCQKPLIKSGLRGTRYFIEFPILGKNVDAFSLILGAENVINQQRKDQ